MSDIAPATRLGIALVAMAAALVTTTPAAAATLAKGGDEAAIRALEDRLVEANRVKDVAEVMDLYAPKTDVIIYDIVPPRQFHSQGNWEKNVAGYFASFDGAAGLEIEDLKIDVSGDLAYAFMVHHFFGKQTGGSQLNLRARVTDVYRKINHRWYIVHEHVSVPVDIKTGRPDLQSAQ